MATSHEEVMSIIRAVLDNLDTETEQRKNIRTDLTVLAEYIQNLHTELVEMYAFEAGGSQVLSATDELDMVVSETAIATDIIMDACESIEKIAQGLKEPAQESLIQAITSVYEACGFQDITRQRVTKVIQTFKMMEKTVKNLISSGPGNDGGSTVHWKEQLSLYGPQRKGSAIYQVEIDKLFDSF